MRIIALVILLFLMSFSLCMADNTPLQGAYSLYYQGKINAAIKIMEDYVKDYPDPRALYFLGYAYYELKRMDTAIKYFNEAYLIDPDFSPVAKKGN